MKATIVLEDDEDGTVNLSVKFSDNINLNEPPPTMAISTAIEIVKLLTKDIEETQH